MGVPLGGSAADVAWPCNIDDHHLAFFPEHGHGTDADALGSPRFVSFGSLYGGNSLLAQKWFGLDWASVLAHREGWMAEHCAVVTLTDSEDRKFHIAAIFPSACGKSSFALQIPTIPGWTVRCVSENMAWLRQGADGRLYATNPESGFFGVATGTSQFNNLSLMVAMRKGTNIFVNAALTPEGDVWWEGKTKEAPAQLEDWRGQAWTPASATPAAHPNARYTFPAANCPVMDEAWSSPNGVPIDAFLLGGRRSTTVPLVAQALSWEHGVFLGAVLSSETTHATDGATGVAKRDPFAFRSFLGYRLGDYLQHWGDMGQRLGRHAPLVFQVNFFRRDSAADGAYLWPGFGDNARVLKWVCQRVRGEVGARRTAVGLVPHARDLDLTGLDLSREVVENKLLAVNAHEWMEECKDMKKFLGGVESLPGFVASQLTTLEKSLQLELTKVPTTDRAILDWVESTVRLCKPDAVRWCDGSEEEYHELCQLLCEKETFVKLNESLRPNSYLARSTEDDVARVEDRTFICSTKKEDAGPTNNWMEPAEMKEKLNKLYDGCMKGRTMYIIPFCMGPLNSRVSKYGIEITDSAYVVVNMKIMTRMGIEVLHYIEQNAQRGDPKPYLPCLHSVGKPLQEGEKDVRWPSNPQNKYITHFPEDPSVMSFGSGYGGNALLGKKCFALRIASTMARREGWLAEHCLILGLTSPEGKKYYIAAAFPSACGKTNLAMLVPTIPGWKVRCVGDDIAWMYVGEDGRLYGVNPERGYFGVAPGTSDYTNQSAIQTMRSNSLFTNVALTPEGDVWWEGKSKELPPVLEDWTYKQWTPDCGRKAAHPNARYTTPAAQCPVIDPEWENPRGVPISAIIFGGRRSTMIPLIYESFNWQHGTFLGSVCSSETTAAAAGQVGVVRRDPFAMLPFCGYNMADYWQHWLDVGAALGDKAPKVFYVNWFRKDAKGRWLWPGFGENSRVLKWVCEMIDGVGAHRDTPIGRVPTEDALDLMGLDVAPADVHELLRVDSDEWKPEVADIRKFYATFGDKLPAELRRQVDELEKRLSAQ